MTALKGLLDILEADSALLEPLRLRERSQALDRLERALDFAAYDLGGGSEQARARGLRARLEALDQAFYDELREDIRRSGTRLLQWARQTGEAATGEHYDHLDELVSGVLRLPAPGDDVGALGEEMVFYQPTPARHAFDLLRRLSLDADDVLIDLGAGLGHVPLLVAACTGAHAHGIEIEPAYVASARACAAELGLGRASFACTDAREAGLDAGNVYYLYTPFTGAILRQVLDALAQQARGRTIRVCTLGPCTSVVAAEPWLDGDALPRSDRIAVFVSR
ncbi:MULTISPECIES: methyltransferase domain-containing protein [unclassified Lysobacter]|uniref:SAM-dependent methyltransferase n=1 Tax=unclassified Lysobacter TaxID=2635362 RepID=UPI0007003ECC|nr:MULTISPECIES: methyltransferase domain-containing protein [unclassified Lysobacter]KRC32033.1 hypothetical protein ASE10_15835 [Lysobacter sp. Root76]KRD67496.1 hypothetical protein ASE45_12010 [Lysobacter sp. Root96]